MNRYENDVHAVKRGTRWVS